MKKYLSDYILYIEDIINNNAYEKNIDDIISNHLNQIEFMQHERLIHLIVTALFAVLLFLSIGILMITNKIVFFILTMFILCLVIPYVAHYYFLENNVQKMYAIYNKLLSIKLDSSK